MKASEQIRAGRAVRRCPQITLAKLSGLSRYMISLFECGYREPTRDEFAKLKGALIKFERRGVVASKGPKRGSSHA